MTSSKGTIYNRLQILQPSVGANGIAHCLEIRSEDPNQHLKDFLKLVDSLNLDVANMERMCLRLFKFSLHDQASNWLERLPAGSISTLEDLTTRFLAQFFPPGRTAKLRNDILMFQQHQGESLSEAISTPSSTSKTPDWRLLELEDQINFLLKGSRPTARPSSTHVPQAYAEAVYSNPHPRNLNEPSRQNSFTFRECTSPYPQPHALGTTFEARVREYMPAHTERIERIENAIFKQREEINDRMTEMFGLLKELTTSSEIQQEVSYTWDNKEAVEAPSSQPVGYYLKHRINKKLIEGLVENHRGPVYEAILKKQITKKEDIGGNFEIPCNIGGLKHINDLVDQGSDVNVMPLSTYKRLTDKRHAEMDIRLFLAIHSYIYPLGIAEDVLVDVAGYVYPVDFIILDIKEDQKRPFILGTSFLTTTKAVIKLDKGTITLRSGKSKMGFHKIPESLCKIKRGIKNDIEPIAPTMIVNRLVLEWEERIKLHQDKEMEFDQWRSKTFKNKRPALVKVESEFNDKGKVTKFFKKNEEEIFTEAGDGVRIYHDGITPPAMFLALGWHLEEIHVTWAHLEKKRTRLRLYTIYLEELCIQSVETASQVSSDGVRIFKVTASWI
ncbi:zinc finger, CCHC-type containing protein [Tanacetum coccineum]|uniref:Zinc finger, CCHC-type containing protein n=1 Tax=Tanacetum coccineum TaxID=301880 RepID=A0ABQ5ICG0_9ASTR